MHISVLQRETLYCCYREQLLSTSIILNTTIENTLLLVSIIPYQLLSSYLIYICILIINFYCFFFFFFQAEDGIRDYKVTGVQTCALPILLCGGVEPEIRHAAGHDGSVDGAGGPASRHRGVRRSAVPPASADLQRRSQPSPPPDRKSVV